VAAVTLAVCVAAAACGGPKADGGHAAQVGGHATPASGRAAAVGTQVPARPAPFTATGPVVALGDSYTAGLLLPLDTTANPPGCFRSTANYASLVAKALHTPEFTDAACESAGTADITSPEKTGDGVNPPQLNALAQGDSLVMLTLGGDDLGFTRVMDACMKLSFHDLLGRPCQARYQAQMPGLIAAEKPKLTAALDAIHQKATRARVLLLGYPDLFPQHGGCWPAVPITNGDVTFLRSAESALNTMLAGAAAATGTTYVDTYAATIGHDMCQNSKVKDVEGLIPTSTAWTFHPNARGQAAMAARILAALGHR
jgi:lysophospholipase L1-like esterase